MWADTNEGPDSWLKLAGLDKRTMESPVRGFATTASSGSTPSTPKACTPSCATAPAIRSWPKTSWPTPASGSCAHAGASIHARAAPRRGCMRSRSTACTTTPSPRRARARPWSRWQPALWPPPSSRRSTTSPSPAFDFAGGDSLERGFGHAERPRARGCVFALRRRADLGRDSQAVRGAGHDGRESGLGGLWGSCARSCLG